MSTADTDRRAAPRPVRLIGRDEELNVLSRLAARHSAGNGYVVSLDGEAGIGKTALLGAFASLARDEAVHVVWTRCTEIDQIRPFGALLDALDCRLQHPDPAHRRVAEALVSGADPLVDPFRLVDTEGSWRLPVQEAIVDLLLEMLDRHPVMLTVDDVQWADAGTLGVVLSMARRTTTTPFVLAWTQRTSVRLDVLDQIRDRHRDRLVRIELGPLTEPAAREVGADLLGGSLDDAQAARLQRAGGNPFFIAALAAHGEGDETPSDAVLRWVARLPTPTADLLGTAALLGIEFDARILSTLNDEAVGEIVTLLQPAVRAGLIHPVGAGRYSFAHDLIRMVVADDLPKSLRAALHRDIAHALQGAGSDVGIIAQHRARGARPGDDEAAEQIRRACHHVVRNDAASAAKLLARAAALCTPGSLTWAAVTADRITALQWAGRPTAALALADEAVTQATAPGALARVRIVRASSLGLVNDIPAMAAEYRLIADDPSTQPAVRALVLAETATLYAWGIDRASGRAFAEEALALAGPAGSVQAELQALCALSTMALFDGDIDEAVTHGRVAVTRGRGRGVQSPACSVYLGLALGHGDKPDEADIWFRQGQNEAEAVTDLWLVSRYVLARMSVEILTGTWESVVADAEGIIALHDDTGIGSGMPQAPAAAGIVAIRRGDPGDVVHRYRDLVAKHATAGAEPSGMLFAAWFQGLLAEREGRVDEAASTLQFTFDVVSAITRLTQLWLAPDLVRVLIAAGNVDGAAAISHSIDRFASDVVGTPSSLGIARLGRGLVAAAQGDPSATTLLREAVAYLRTGRRLPALLDALDALDRLDQLDPAGRRERQHLLAQLGVRRESLSIEPEHEPQPGAAALNTTLRPARPDAAAADGLTATERSIGLLIADGLSNPLIAARMGLSKRTVEYHVSNMYVKLAVNSRVALAANMR